ncbi:MAG TPA: 2OG-Fe(II) oxygenase [Albitalea sp.]|nr:2OG-Fe(II) oxygenase [Albitalea sp.]
MHSTIADLPAWLTPGDAAAPDHVSIRGVPLRIDQLVDTNRFQPDAVAALNRSFVTAPPFPHLVIDGLFNADLLDLVVEEFDLLDASCWRRSQDGQHERTMRTLPGSRLGRAAQMYFDVLHSSWFVQFLQQVTEVGGLVTDPHLHGGGFHEARDGGRFRIHTDFNKHERTKLDTELVLITYLNRDWDPAWGGSLELWSAKPKECVRRIEPVFGRTFLMRETPHSFHGHPLPLQMPAGQVRRSVAAYFYSHRGNTQDVRRHPTLFMDSSTMRMLRIAARELTPPLVWNGVKRLLGR